MSGPLTTLLPALHWAQIFNSSYFLTLIEYINWLDVYLSRFQSTVCCFADSDQGHLWYAEKQRTAVLPLVDKGIYKLMNEITNRLQS